mmetsp:Transcript_26917/g.77281  ORF Transcript_26917/g.77281 Transcript_26917/m.77281 type:complete len:113 (+) Transcript_26917:829-1167(+)
MDGWMDCRVVCLAVCLDCQSFVGCFLFSLACTVVLSVWLAEGGRGCGSFPLLCHISGWTTTATHNRFAASSCVRLSAQHKLPLTETQPSKQSGRLIQYGVPGYHQIKQEGSY